MKINSTQLNISKQTYYNDRYVLPENYDNVSHRHTYILNPYFYLLNYEFDVSLENYEQYAYNILKTTQNFFSNSSNVVEIGSDFGYTAKLYSNYVYNFYCFDNDKNVRDITKHNLYGIKNTHIFDLTETKQLYNIDSEFYIVRDELLLGKHVDVIAEKLPTILLKHKTLDLTMYRTYGYEIYKLGIYCLLVPFYFNKPIHLQKYE